MFNNWPYTNLNELNLDWILQQVKEMMDKYTDLDSAITAGVEAVQQQEQTSLQDMDNMKMTIISAINGARDIAIVDVNATKTNALNDIETDKTNALAAIAALGATWDAHYESLIAEMPADLASITQTLAILGRILTGESEQTVTFFMGDYAGGSKTTPTPAATSDVSTNMIIGGAGFKFAFTLDDDVDADTKIYTIHWFEGKNADTGVYTDEHIVSCGNVRTYTWTVPDTCYGFSITLRNSDTLFTEAPASDIVTLRWYTVISDFVSVDGDQDFTDEQKAQGRENIGAAADDDVTELKSAFESDYNVQGYPDQINASNYAEKLPDLNNAEPNRIYAINLCLQNIANIPDDSAIVSATVMTFTKSTYNNKTWYIQFLVGNGNKFYYRSCWSSVWSDWAQNIDLNALTAYTETDNLYLHGYNPIITADNYSELLSDLDNAEANRIYIINGCFQSIANIPATSTAVNATVMTFSRGYRANKSWYVQYAIGNRNDFYYRSCWGGVWSDWQKVVTIDDVISYIDTNDQLLEGYKDQISSSNYATKLADLNNAEPNRIYAINQCLQNIANIPSDTSAVTATVMTFTWKTYSNKTWYIQFLIGNGNAFYYRSCWGGVWSAWKYTVSQADINTSIETDTNKGASKIQDFFVSTCVRKDLTKGISAASKIITIGDSITAGSPSDGYYTWVAPFCDYLGCTATNKAIGGACFGESNPEIPQNKWISTQIAAVTATEWAECDFVFVAAGTNDARYTASFDEIAEKVSADLAAILAALSANGNTTAHVIFITPTRRNTKNNEINLRLPEISGIIENIALTNGCSVICGFDFPIPTDNVIGEEDTIITKLTSDNLHPNLTGSKVYAQSVINAIM